MQEEADHRRSSLLKSSVVVSAMTMISRVFGLARDMVVAYFFGAAAGADANNTVHVHRGITGGDSDLDEGVHGWLNPVARAVVTVHGH